MDPFESTLRAPTDITEQVKNLERKGHQKMPGQWLIGICFLLVIWQLAAHHYASDLLLPPPRKTFIALVQAVQKPEIINNLLITLRRVATGFIYAVVIGLPLGYLMGYSKTALKILEPIVSSLRQVPIMAWVPLTIVWFGLGDGPTVFLIAFSGVFPILLNTIAGVQSISRDYYNAARSMGAGPVSILLHIIVPGSLPDVLTGMRLGLSAGWMSVICAEFIATSAGFGFAMVEAQTRMQTDTLIALMIISALVGFTMDSGIRLFRRIVTRWQGVH